MDDTGSSPPIRPVGRSMHYRRATLVTVFVLFAGLYPRSAMAQLDQPQATFKSSVDLVSVTAVIRDKKGRVVRTLTADDVTVTDAGHLRTIVGMQSDDQSPASIALLVDGSGSMRLGSATVSSQQICEMILANLRRDHDAGRAHEFRHPLVDPPGIHPGIRSDSRWIGRGRSLRVDVDLRCDRRNGGRRRQPHAEPASRGRHHRRSG